MNKRDITWTNKWQAIIDFMTTNHRNPSKHRPEEHFMLDWIKFNRKALRHGTMNDYRKERMLQLEELRAHLIRPNQYVRPELPEEPNLFEE